LQPYTVPIDNNLSQSIFSRLLPLPSTKDTGDEFLGLLTISILGSRFKGGG
jgi:hypothetical protein